MHMQVEKYVRVKVNFVFILLLLYYLLLFIYYPRPHLARLGKQQQSAERLASLGIMGTN